MRILRRHKKASVKPTQGYHSVSADTHVPLSTLGGSLLALESRIMFDGAAVATVGTVTTEQIAQSQADAFLGADDATAADHTSVAPTGEPQPTIGDQALFDALAAYDLSTARQEILFLSTSVQDYQQLLDGISPNVEVIILDPARDGVEQMAEALAGRMGIDAIHLIGEGTEAELHLGTSFLTQESISSRYVEQFQRIGQSLSQNADLLIYGCNFGRGEAGQVAMRTLAALTGADVAASTDRTGHSNEFGDWMLETSIGSVEASVVIDDVTQAAWEGVLATYTVDTTNDVINGGDGVTSLREAITAANGALGTDTIVFNIAGVGVHTINLASALPTITDTVILDATTQSGYVAGSPVIVLDGTGAGAEANGFVLQASNSTITGFRIQNFVSGTTSVTGTGIVIDGTSGGDNNTISQNYLTNNSESVTGSVGAVSITGAADNNLITNNQLIDNNSDGIRFADALSTDNQFTNNTISGSGDDGVKLVGANITFTGNTVSNSQRLSAGAAGIELVTVTGTSVVSNNLISNDGTHGSEGGVWIADSSAGVTVGNNTITGWSGSGIAIGQTSTGIHLTQNAISNNGRLGIDLFPTAPQTDPANGVTPNDVGDGDAGANDLTNTPVLTAAVVRTASAVDISGSLSTLALVHNYRIEFFASTSSDPSGFGEGERYLGFTDVTTDGAGTVSFNVTLTASVTAGEVITATTNDLVLLETSEFSQYIVAANTAPVLDASKSPGLTAINEDAGAPSGVVGTLVSQLVDFDSPAGQVDNVTDTDSGALLGIAITGADTANGTWLYSTNNGASWNALGAVSDASTRLLAADANTRLYFQPNADYNGTIANAITFRAWDQTSGSNGTLTDTSANGGTTAFSTATDTVSLVVNAVNDVPTITNLSGDSLAYSEGDGAVVVEQGGNALVVDVDSSDFNTGTLTVSFTAGSDSTEDVLSIRNQGIGAGQIGVSGANVTYQGVTIGTYAGGSSGSNFVVTFNASATPTAVTALAQNITYENTDTNAPTTGARTVRFVLTDGDGGTSANYDTMVTVSGVNDAPIAADDRLALDFDGVDDYVQISSNPVFEVTTHVTMEAWINPDASTNSRQIFINKEGEYEVALDPNGHIQWAFANADPGWAWHDTGVVVPLHTWSHIAISYDNGVITTYLNGVAAEVYNGSGAIGDNHPALDELRIGGRTNAPAGQYFDGRINEVQVWNVARTGAEILGDMSGSLTGSETGLLGSWRFNENTGGVANNLVTANDDGTLGGGVAGQTPGWTGYRMNEDSSLNVGVPGILSNDFDADGNSLTAALVVGPSSAASFTLNPDGSFTYVPIANFSGTDSFTYRVNDGAVNSNIATVWIQVDPVNDVPVVDLNAGGAGQDVTTSFTEQTPVLIAPVGTLSDVDSATLSSLLVTLTTRPDGNAVEALSLNGTATTAASGAGLTVSYTAATGVLSITGSAATATYQTILQGILYNDTSDTPTTSNRSITVTVNDGAVNSTTQTVTLTVTAQNDAPTITAIADQTIPEDGTTGALAFTVSDVETAAGSLTVTAVSSNTTLIPNGNLTLVDLGGGSWTIAASPALNQNGGPVTITVTVNDGTTTTNETFDVTITAQNDAPVVASNTGSIVARGGTDTITTAELQVTDVDNPAAQLTYTVTLGPVNGQLELTTAPGVAINSFTQAQIDAGQVVYVHNGSFTVSDSFTFTVSDGAGGSIGATTFGITVTPVNSVPSLATNAGSTVVQGLTDLITPGELQVTDLDNTPAQLTYTVTTAPVNGQLELITAPGVVVTSFTQADIDAGRLVFVHSGAPSTNDSFTFTVNDGAGGTIGVTTFTFTVTPFVPPPPPPPPPPDPGPGPGPGPGPVPGPPGPPSGGVAPPVLPPPVLISMVGAIDDPVRQAAMPSRTFASRVEQPDIVLEEAPVLELEPLSNTVKTIVAVGHKLAERLTRLADTLERAMQEREQQGLLLGRVASVSGMALSVGFVAWILRGGALLASFLVSMPAWRHFDPLPVLGSAGRDRRERDRKVREGDEQEQRQFRGLDRVLDKSATPVTRQETGRVRKQKSS